MSSMPPLYAGYVWRQGLTVEYDDPAAPAPFPSGVALTAHVRRNAADDSTLAVLTTANGGLVRLNDTTLQIVITGTQSATWTPGTVHLDIVRTDLDPDEHLNIHMAIAVARPVTRGLP